MIRIKYAIRNYILMWKQRLFKSVVAELFLVICFATILFSCGIYDNYLKTIKELNASQEEKSLFIHLENSEVTIMDLKGFFSELPDELISNSQGMASMVLINGNWVNIQYRYENQYFAYPDAAFENLIGNKWLISGRLYTDEELINGAKVAVVPYGLEDAKQGVACGDNIMINGIPYEIIGVVDSSVSVIVPITALSDTSKVKDIIIGYPYRITKSMYDSVVQCMNQHFHSASINEMNFSAAEEQRQYQRIMRLQVLLVIFSGISVLILFAVHIRENEIKFAAFNFCGASRMDVFRIYVLHWWGLLIPSIVIAIALFHCSTRGWMGRLYPYLRDYACVRTYILYVVVILCFLLLGLSLVEGYYTIKKKKC